MIKSTNEQLPNVLLTYYTTVKYRLYDQRRESQKGKIKADFFSLKTAASAEHRCS